MTWRFVHMPFIMTLEKKFMYRRVKEKLCKRLKTNSFFLVDRFKEFINQIRRELENSIGTKNQMGWNVFSFSKQSVVEVKYIVSNPLETNCETYCKRIGYVYWSLLQMHSSRKVGHMVARVQTIDLWPFWRKYAKQWFWARVKILRRHWKKNTIACVWILAKKITF